PPPSTPPRGGGAPPGQRGGGGTGFFLPPPPPWGGGGGGGGGVDDVKPPHPQPLSPEAWERGEKPQTLAFIREGKVKRILASRWLLVPLVACAAAVLGCNRNGQQAPPPKPPEVLVSFPVTEQVTDYEYFTGQTVPVHSVDIRARDTGYLDKTDFKDGPDVTKDTPLFRIDPRPYKAERDRAKASLAQAIARRDLAQAKLERTRTAFLTRAASKDEL